MPEPEDQIDNSRITINGQEYDPTEAQEFIELGRKTREAESKFNVTFDSIMPAYTKANERAKQADQYETELSEARDKLKEFEAKQERGTDTTADLTEAKEAARKIGLLTQEDIKDKYVSREDLDKYYDEREKRSEAIKAVRSEASKLATEIDGSDGRPKFNEKVVLAYAQAYGLPTLKDAYDDMHADALSDWQKQQVDAKRNPGLKTLAQQRGNKEPVKVAISKDNAKDALADALWGSKE